MLPVVPNTSSKTSTNTKAETSIETELYSTSSITITNTRCGLKQNSLFGTSRAQNLASPEEFCTKIRAGVAARRCADFMVIARIEALIAGAGMEEVPPPYYRSTTAPLPPYYRPTTAPPAYCPHCPL